MKKNIFVLLIISLFIVSFTGCSNNNSIKKSNDKQSNQANSMNTSDSENKNDVDKTNLSIKIAGLKGPTSIGMIKLFEDKPSLGENIDSTYEVANTPDIINAKLISKEVDIAALPTNLASVMYNKTDGAYKLAAVNTFGMLYLVTNGIEINDWNDLKGKKINIIAKGSTPDFVFNYLLKQNNIDAQKDVDLDYSLTHAELAQAVIANKVDIAILPEPFVTMVTMKNKNVKVALNLQDEWKTFQGENSPISMGCIVVRSEFAKSNPEAVNTFLAEYEKSINWVNNNNAEAGVLVEKHGILSKAKLIEKAIPNCNIKFLNADDSMDTVNSFLKILYDFNPDFVGGKLPDEGFFYKK
jgi:NitT/TauT family transport system substrate-binding protein